MARRCSTLCLPIGKDDYLRLIDTPTAFRRWIDQAFRDWPELFPTAFALDYTPIPGPGGASWNSSRRKTRPRSSPATIWS